MILSAWRATGLFGVVTAIFTVGFAGFLHVQPRSDLTEHLGYTMRIHSFADIESPHFLLQLLLKAVIAAGLTPTFAMALLLGGCYGGMAILLVREIDRRRITLSALQLFLFVPAILIASHVFLLTLFRRNLYFGYFVPIAYHNPTQQLGKLFALWIWFRFCKHYIELREGEASWQSAWSTGGLCVLSALAKPSFLIAFLPVGACVGLVTLLRRHWRRAFQLAAGIALPSVGVLLWQARMAYGANVASEVLFAPFAVFNAQQTMFKLPASLAFPLVMTLTAWRTRTWNSRLGWTALFLAIALFQTLFLAEAGDVGAGNFAWTGQTAVFLAYVESALLLLGHAWPARWRYATWSVFTVHVACGIIWYAAGFFPDRVAFL